MNGRVRAAPNRGPFTMDALFVAALAVGTLLAVLWTALAAGIEGAAVVSGQRLVDLHDPMRAFLPVRSLVDDHVQAIPGGSTAVLWGIAAAAAALLAVPATWAVVRVARWLIGGERYIGQATRAEVAAVGSPRAVLRDAARLRPTLKGGRVTPTDVAFRLAETARDGSPVWMSVQNNLGVVAGPQTGKTTSTMGVLPLLFPGPAIMTETHRPDLMAMSACQPDCDRPVLVLDPENRVGWPDPVGVDVLAGCEDHGVAHRRASLLVRAATARSDAHLSSNIEFFIGEATSAACAFLHAARLGEMGLGAVLRWTQRWGSDQPVEILEAERGSPEAQSDAEMLRQLYAVAGPQSAGTAGELRNAFACLADPDVVRTFGGGHAHALDIRGFLDARARLYVLGSGREQRTVAPFVALVITEVVEEALARAAASPGRRLDPPLLLDLDEVANIAPLPELPYYLSAGTGSGVCTAWAAQARAQLRRRWGLEAAREIWQSTNWRLWMGGSVEAEDLRELQDLAGEVCEQTLTHHRPDGLDAVLASRHAERYGRQIGVQRVPVFTIEQLRTLRRHHAILLARNLPVTEVVMRPWWERRDVAALVAESTRRFSAVVRGGQSGT